VGFSWRGLIALDDVHRWALAPDTDEVIVVDGARLNMRAADDARITFLQA
jgi:hypothetical protein